MRVLAADIGATHSRLALADAEDVISQRYRNAAFTDLYQVIDRFEDEAGFARDTIDKVVIALPAPVVQQPVRLTNIDWEVDRSRLQSRFPGREVLLVNDFQAAAVGALGAQRLRPLNPKAVAGAAGAAVVTGAGTGLGMAWVADVAAAAMPHATEGGHADFAPADAQQRELHAWLQARHGHVSYERLLCGDGLSAIHAFLGDGTQLPAQQVQQAAQRGDALAVQAVSLFVSVFGGYAGNLALLFNPPAGIYLCGGVVGHLADWFGDDFRQAFYNKGRMRHMVEQVPVHLVDHADIGLQGAIKIAKSTIRT